MINGNYVEFLDNLNYGEEMYLKYKGKIYLLGLKNKDWIQNKPLTGLLIIDTQR